MKAELESLLVAERYQAAATRLAEISGGPDATLAAQVLASVGRVDEAILTVQPYFAQPDRLDADDRDRAFALAARLYGYKRLPGLAGRLIEQGRAACGNSERLALAEGEVALCLDDRTRARRLFGEQHERAPTPAACEWVARVCYVQGDFDTALQFLDQIPPGDRRAPQAYRLRAGILSARRDFAGEAAAWEQVLTLRPDGDNHPNDGINRAFALAAQGKRDEAKLAFDSVFRAHPDGDAGRYARSRRDRLAEAQPDAKRKVLDFPRTQQKRDFCGPACVELCLRALGIELDQDEIAREIKRENGTPMYEIVNFMRGHGVIARRFVASDERICAAIDLGLPVVLQEEYSTTSHVAVVIGYDQALGVLIMQDPMTHRACTRPLGWSESSGQLFGCGAVVVLGRADAGRADIGAQADSAGLVEAEHLALVDQCSRRRRGLAGDKGEDARAEEILDITGRVIAHAPDFRLAWMNRLWAWRDIWDRTHSDGAKAEFLATLYDVRTRFPDDEWPCQNQGYWHLRQGAFAESFAAYLDAHRRDREDGNNLTYMGECQRKLGRFPGAERYFMQGLENNADRGLAEWMLAALYLREVERLDAEAPPADLPGFVVGFVVGDPKKIEKSLSRSRDDLLARAEYFNEICREVQPGNPYHHEVQGFVCLRRGFWQRAAEAFARAANLDASRWYAHFGHAVACEALNQLEEARAILASAAERFQRDPDAHVLFSAFLGRTGHADQAVAALADGLGKLAGPREELAEPLFAALCRTTSSEEAAARLREMVGRFADDEKLLKKAAEAVADEGERGHAIALLRMILERNPDHHVVRARLGRTLVRCLPTRAEGIELLETAAKDFPHWGFARRPLALAYLPTDPARGLAVLESLAEDEDAWTHETRALLLQAMGDPKASEKALRRAVACYDEPPINALLDFANWHIGDNRYARAMELAERMAKTPHEDKDVPHMDCIYLSASRLLGRAQEIVAWVRARCPANLPPENLAWHVYYAYSNSEHDLAAGAAHVMIDQQKTDEERAVWRIREAEQRAHLGDNAALEAEWESAKTVEIWATLTDAFADLERYERADQAAERAYALDPKHAGAIVGLCHSRQRRGDFAGALLAARQMLERYPYDHRGPELLGFIHARLLQVDEALAFSERALDAAPYCHNAYESRAVALFAAGRFDEARLHAEQVLALSPEPEISESESRLILYALGRDRARAAGCHAKIPQGKRDAGAAYYNRLLALAESV